MSTNFTRSFFEEKSGGEADKRKICSISGAKRLNIRSSYKERKVDALALGADEGRSDLRKATGSRKQAMIRGCPNGETRQDSYSVTVY